MPPVMNTSERDERVSLVNNIKSLWTVADPTDIIPDIMRYPGHIGTWPLPILRAISHLASGMPGDEGRHRSVDLLNTGYLIRRADADESATVEPQLQSSDLKFVRDSVGIEPAAVTGGEEASESVGNAGQVMENADSTEPFARGATHNEMAVSNAGEESSDENQASEPSKTPTQQQRIDSGASIQDEGTDSRQHPDPILPGDSTETLNMKWKRWIEYYWNVTDTRTLVPEHMRPRGKLGEPLNRALQNYGGNNRTRGRVLELLYQLARITKEERKDLAWAEIEKKWKSRRAGSEGGKALSDGDVMAALNYFRQLREQQDDPFTNTQGQLLIPAPDNNQSDGEEGHDSAATAQWRRPHLSGRQQKRQRRDAQTTERDANNSPDLQTLLADVGVAEAGLSVAHSRRSSVMARRGRDRASIMASHNAMVDRAALNVQEARRAVILSLKRKRRDSLDEDEARVDEEDGKMGDDGKDERAEQEHDEPEPEEAQDSSDDWAVVFETEDAPQDGEREDQTRGKSNVDKT